MKQSASRLLLFCFLERVFIFVSIDFLPHELLNPSKSDGDFGRLAKAFC